MRRNLAKRNRQANPANLDRAALEALARSKGIVFSSRWGDDALRRNIEKAG